MASRLPSDQRSVVAGAVTGLLERDALRQAVGDSVPPALQKLNLEAFDKGFEYGATLTIGKATTATIFTLKKGVYHYYSSVGKDETAGMSGTLTVK